MSQSMKKLAYKRGDRVSEQIREILTDILLRQKLHNPDAQGVMISSVVLTDDLQHARVYLRLLETEPGEGRKKKAVEAMQRAAAFLRRELGGRLKLRYTPDLRFFWDDGLDRALRVEELLEEIRNEESSSKLN